MMYVGLDVHKKFCQATVLDSGGEIVLRKRIPSKREDIVGFFEKMRDCRVAIESTGVWEFIYETIASCGIDVVLANPLKTRLIAEAKVKTDKVDSEILAQLLRSNMIAESYVPSKQVRELRRMVRERSLMKKVTTSLRNYIYAQLIRRGIEYKRGCLGSKVGRERVREVLDDNRLAYLFDLLEFAERTVKDFSYDELLEHFRRDEDAKVVSTIPGVGYYTALTIIAEYGDISRFRDNTDAVVSYCGLAPRVHQSSTTCYHGSISKRGSPMLRWIPVEATMNHLRYCKEKSDCRLCRFHQRISRRRGRNKARVATAAKLARIIYWMLRLRQPFLHQGLDPVSLSAGERRVLDCGMSLDRIAKKPQ